MIKKFVKPYKHKFFGEDFRINISVLDMRADKVIFRKKGMKKTEFLNTVDNIVKKLM